MQNDTGSRSPASKQRIPIFNIVTVLIGVTRAMPQLIRLLRARHAYGVSVDTAATSMLVSFGWAAYGIFTSQSAIIFASSASGTIFALITLSALRFGRQVRELRIAPVWFVVLLLMGGFGGATGFEHCPTDQRFGGEYSANFGGVQRRQPDRPFPWHMAARSD